MKKVVVRQGVKVQQVEQVVKFFFFFFVAAAAAVSSSLSLLPLLLLLLRGVERGKGRRQHRDRPCAFGSRVMLRRARIVGVGEEEREER